MLLLERMNKEINRHIRSLTYNNTSLEDYILALPFVMRIINSNHSCGRTGYTGPTGRTGPRHDPPDPFAYSTHTSLARLAS